jgi:hypothetical protein
MLHIQVQVFIIPPHYTIFLACSKCRYGCSLNHLNLCSTCMYCSIISPPKYASHAGTRARCTPLTMLHTEVQLFIGPSAYYAAHTRYSWKLYPLLLRLLRLVQVLIVPPCFRAVFIRIDGMSFVGVSGC